MGNKVKSYITEPQRIYTDPIHPDTSDYNVVIPKTTSDAVIVEGSGVSLTEYLEDIGSIQTDTRNSIVSGDNIVKVEDGNVFVGKYYITISNGFNQDGRMINTVVNSNVYTQIDNPSQTDKYLIVKIDGTFEYCHNFDGGRNFPLSPNTNDIFYNDQLRKSYKFNGTSWESYPCVAIATFDNSLLTSILPYNTAWWNEIVLENICTDIPAGMNLSIYTDGSGANFLIIEKGGLVSNKNYYNLDSVKYKNVLEDFSEGNFNGSGDGSYSSVSTNLIPTDITPTDTKGLLIDASNISTLQSLFNSFNPTLDTLKPYCTIGEVPEWFMVTLPSKKSINTYTIKCVSTVDTVRKWSILGSNNSTDWEVIHIVKNANFTEAGQLKEFSTTNTKQYKYIKFVIDNQDQGSSQSVKLGQIRFYSSVPELGVYAILNSNDNVDILTSVNSGPTLPNGYIAYHKIGVVSVDTDGNIINVFPKKSFGVDITSKYESIQNDLSTKLNSDFSNISSEAQSLISYLCAPRVSINYSIYIPNGVTYRVVESGYMRLFDPNNSTYIYNGKDLYTLGSNDTLVASAPAGYMCSAYVAKGTFIKVVGAVNNGSISRLVPAIGETL